MGRRMPTHNDSPIPYARPTRFISWLVAATAVTFALAAGCNEGSSDDDDDDDGEGASSSSGPEETCDLKAESWYSDCDSGCGDVMVCQSFCSDCELRCMVPCTDSSDCEAVGAGSCQESTYGSNRCSAAPTMCPGDKPSSTSSASTGGGSCSETGTECSVNGDCCDFASGNALCVNYEGYGPLCGGTCSSNADCAGGCCGTTADGTGVCAPSEFCG
jgi:hypothetical protein